MRLKKAGFFVGLVLLAASASAQQPVDLHDKKGVVDPKDLKTANPPPPKIQKSEPPPPQVPQKPNPVAGVRG